MLLLALFAPMLVIVVGAAIYLILGPQSNPGSGAAIRPAPAAAARVLSTSGLPGRPTQAGLAKGVIV